MLFYLDISSFISQLSFWYSHGCSFSLQVVIFNIEH